MSDIMDPRALYYKRLVGGIIDRMKERGFEAVYCENSAQATQQALTWMSEPGIITWGGSETVRECGLLDAIRASGREVIDREHTPAEERSGLYSHIVQAEYFLTSANAVTYDGELMNMDGNGNRIACLITGPTTVIAVVGINKLVPDRPTGVARIHNVAAPINAIRLHRDLPCAQTGLCSNCHEPDCICGSLVVTRHMRKGRMKVIFVGESLGY